MTDIWSLQELLSLGLTLTIIIDPFAAAWIFVSLTAHQEIRVRRRTAINAHIIAGITFILFAAGGGEVLRLLGIGLPAFRIAGGLLLFLIAIEMVFGKRGKRRERAAERALSERAQDDDSDSVHEIAVFPIAIPLLAGPGAIATVLLLSAGPHGDSLGGMTLLVGMLLAILVFSLALFLLASHFGGGLGPSVTLVFTRLLGILMAALAAQFILDGVMATFFG